MMTLREAMSSPDTRSLHLAMIAMDESQHLEFCKLLIDHPSMDKVWLSVPHYWKLELTGGYELLFSYSNEEGHVLRVSMNHYDSSEIQSTTILFEKVPKGDEQGRLEDATELAWQEWKCPGWIAQVAAYRKEVFTHFHDWIEQEGEATKLVRKLREVLL